MFQFTHPGRGATTQTSVIHSLGRVSIHAPREGCDSVIHSLGREAGVSIHAPREGCDADVTGDYLIRLVSIHAPREGCDVQTERSPTRSLSFQFTHPGRGATPPSRRSPAPIGGFNSRTPGGVRRRVVLKPYPFNPVSIHAPREGCDAESSGSILTTTVSIHAPREGCDKTRLLLRQSTLSFNSRTPGGVRHYGVDVPQGRGDVSIHAPREGCDRS